MRTLRICLLELFCEKWVCNRKQNNDTLKYNAINLKYLTMEQNMIELGRMKTEQTADNEGEDSAKSFSSSWFKMGTQPKGFKRLCG